MYDHRFRDMFSAFNFTLEDGDIGIKNKKIPIFLWCQP
jgi:hypothetical protein